MVNIDLIDLSTMSKTRVNNFNKHKEFIDLVLTIGVFDGVHYAHEQIINTMIIEAKKNNKKTALMTFDPHPDFVLGEKCNNDYIQPLSERIKRFKELGIDYLFIVEFSKELANIDYHDYYKNYLSNFAFFVVGYDFTFGHKGLGKAEFLKEMKQNTIIVSEIDYNNSKVSSTRIRELLHEGKVDEIEPLLDKDYSITGKVMHGSNIGVTLGFPTANIEFEKNSCDIMNGVYIVSIEYDNHLYNGLANVGNNPSINYVRNKRLEVYIFDFNEDIYDKTIKVNFKYFIRKEEKFNNKEDLINQIKKDILIAKSHFNN